MKKIPEKQIEEFYDEEVKKYPTSPKCTMSDIFIRNLEVQKILEIIKRIEGNTSLKILEIGCGNGFTISKIHKFLHSSFVGLDSNKNMIKVASKRNLKNVDFILDNILKTKLSDETFDLVFSERCLINLQNWSRQKMALEQIRRMLRKGGHYVMMEAFLDGLKMLNGARKSIGLENIPQTWYNCYFDKNRLERFLHGKFVTSNDQSKIVYENFLSSYYFGSRVIYPALVKINKITFNNKFVEFFSMLSSIGNYSPIQVCVLKKI